MKRSSLCHWRRSNNDNLLHSHLTSIQQYWQQKQHWWWCCRPEETTDGRWCRERGWRNMMKWNIWWCCQPKLMVKIVAEELCWADRRREELSFTGHLPKQQQQCRSRHNSSSKLRQQQGLHRTATATEEGHSNGGALTPESYLQLLKRGEGRAMTTEVFHGSIDSSHL